MPRLIAQSDFSVVREPEVALSAAADPVALPSAQAETTEASAFATRWVMRITLLLLLALAVLCAVGPHIPSGE